MADIYCICTDGDRLGWSRGIERAVTRAVREARRHRQTVFVSHTDAVRRRTLIATVYPDGEVRDEDGRGVARPPRGLTWFTVANIAGGDELRFRLLDGGLSGRAIKHCRRLGYGGPVFGGPARDLARAAWERMADVE